ncbi:MAG TPA: serine/threonine-protein kinase [Polyangiaceae bacterium]|nr:serine/threonine-protein kinase [Polyangiaceae bacterium]
MIGGDPSELVTRVDGATSEDEPATVALPVLDARDHPKSLASQTAQVVMNVEDRQRMRSFALILAILGLVGALNEVTVYRTGSTTLRLVATAMLLGVSVGGMLLHFIGGRLSENARVRLTLGFVVYLVATALVEALHLGVLSAFQSSIVLVMFIFGLDGRKRFVFPLATLAFVVIGVPSLLIAADVIDDPGVFTTPYATPAERVSAILGMFVVYFAAFWLSRTIRRSMQAAVERASEAVLRAQQHEMLLAEANLNLDAVARADARRGGRYTGTIVGDFRLAGIIGRGGMGEVYGATRTSDGRAAAVKLLTQQALGDSGAVARFLREVQMASQIRVPHVVEVLGTGEAPGGEPYLAMELLLGHDLAWHLRQATRLPIEEVLVLAEHVAAGLQAAHAAGIVHRDLKPQNLFLDKPDDTRGTWKILDFGVGKIQGSGATLTGFAVVGTPGYMAPEQVRGGAVDASADVFALGAVAYRALTGHPPFGVAEVQAVFDVVSKQPPAPTTLRRDIPRDFDYALAIALAKNPSERFANAPELAQALRAASRQDLPPSMRARALAILRARPWGSVIRE